MLGQVFITMMKDLLDALAAHKHIGNLGAPTAIPDNVTDFTDLKDDPIDNEDIVSDIAFTEKGA